jgi:hypothetical protein
MDAWERGPSAHFLPDMARQRTFHEKVLNNFEVSVAQRAEVLIGPFSLLQAVSRPDTILQHQTDEELDDWVSFIVLNYK